MTNQQNLMWPILLVIFGASSSFVDGSMPLESGDKLDVLTDSLIHEFMSKLDANDNLLEDNLLSVNDYSDEDQDHLNRMVREYESRPYRLQTRDDLLLPHEPQPRKEYLEHSSLWGHQYMQGGAGEGIQRLKPDGSVNNVQVIKTDAVLPAYCNPPNPCPLGYTSEDGCIEDFTNSAGFSREYQSSQECMCDTEHMFDCPGNNDKNELETLARSIQNEGLMDSTLDKLVQNMHQQQKDHKVVAKKFFTKKNRSVMDSKMEELMADVHQLSGDHKVVAKKFFVTKPKAN